MRRAARREATDPPRPRADDPPAARTAAMSGAMARRALLGSVLLLPLAGAGRAAAPRTEASTLLVPGPENGAAAQWAARAVRRMGRVLPQAPPPRPVVVGGPDGVTAANRFETVEAGDGRTLLVVNGSALLALLSGTERARYRPGGWLPLCASWGSALVAGRGAMPGPGQARAPSRLLVPTPDAPEAAALLAVESLGFPVLPTAVPPAAAEHAFLEGALDVLLLTGPNAAARAAALGATPWFGFGEHGAAVPDYGTISTAVPAPLRQAVAAAAGASQLRGALLLPGLTSANVVAAWRQAALRWREGELAEPGEGDGEPLAGADAALALATLLPPPDAVLVWRDWLRRRLGWRPD